MNDVPVMRERSYNCVVLSLRYFSTSTAVVRETEFYALNDRSTCLWIYFRFVSVFPIILSCRIYKVQLKNVWMNTGILWLSATTSISSYLTFKFTAIIIGIRITGTTNISREHTEQMV